MEFPRKLRSRSKHSLTHPRLPLCVCVYKKIAEPAPCLLLLEGLNPIPVISFKADPDIVWEREIKKREESSSFGETPSFTLPLITILAVVVLDSSGQGAKAIHPLQFLRSFLQGGGGGRETLFWPASRPREDDNKGRPKLLSLSRT